MNGKLLSLFAGSAFLLATSLSAQKTMNTNQPETSQPAAHSQTWAPQNMPQNMTNHMWMQAEGASQAAKSVLNLTDSQVQNLKNLRQDFIKNTRGDRSELRSNNQQLHTLLQTSNPDPAQVGNLVIQRKAADAKLTAARNAYHESAMKVLTQSQKDKLNKIQAAVNEAPEAFPLAALGLIHVPPMARMHAMLERPAAS